MRRLSPPLPPASCSPAAQTHQLLSSKVGRDNVSVRVGTSVHTCLLGCGRGADSGSFSSARTGGREKPISSSIPSRIGTGSEAKKRKNFFFIIITKVLISQANQQFQYLFVWDAY